MSSDDTDLCKLGNTVEIFHQTAYFSVLCTKMFSFVFKICVRLMQAYQGFVRKMKFI